MAVSTKSGGASAYKWTNADEPSLRGWVISQDQFSQMAEPALIQSAAESAANVVKTGMQALIFRQPTINGEDGPDYISVAERISVWSDSQNTYVGVPAGDPEFANAQLMDAAFPVLDTAFSQSEEAAGAAFERALQEGVF